MKIGTPIAVILGGLAVATGCTPTRLCLEKSKSSVVREITQERTSWSLRWASSSRFRWEGKFPSGSKLQRPKRDIAVLEYAGQALALRIEARKRFLRVYIL